jgi:hypothetical protein
MGGTASGGNMTFCWTDPFTEVGVDSAYGAIPFSSGCIDWKEPEE